MLVCLHIPYSRKLQWVKTFANFTALLLSAKDFSANFMRMRGSAGTRSGQSVKVSP